MYLVLPVLLLPRLLMQDVIIIVSTAFLLVVELKCVLDRISAHSDSEIEGDENTIRTFHPTISGLSQFSFLFFYAFFSKDG